VKDRFEVSDKSGKPTSANTTQVEKKENHYVEARLQQDIADLKWDACKKVGQCRPEL
jgi:hypothetical protein